MTQALLVGEESSELKAKARGNKEELGIAGQQVW